MTTATSTETKALTDLKAYLAEMADLGAVRSLLGWDTETHMCKGGAQARGHMMATMARISHQRRTSPELNKLLSQLEKAGAVEALAPIDQKLIQVARKDFDKATKLSSKLVESMAQATSEAHTLWIEAREKQSFSHFLPILERIVDLNKQKTEELGYQNSPYDALLDGYEENLTVDQIDPVFKTMKAGVVDLLQRIQASDVYKKQAKETSCLAGTYDTSKQLEFSRWLLNEMGFADEHCRLDLAVHPFSTNTTSNDIRLTTRIHENDVFSAISSTMHEGGHGLYEHGIDIGLMRTPLGGGTSLGIHESQSRMWENLIGRSHAFWVHYLPALQKTFPEQLKSVSVDKFYQAINRVRPSFIRVEADEVTYNLHIVIRYEIERDIIEGRLALKDIPEAWNSKYESYLGITPDNDTLGCLQDVHWSHGSFGYFPTYSLGNLYSSQFYNTMGSELGDLNTFLSKGELGTLKTWLNKAIHFSGRSENADDIAKRVSGELLNPTYFIDYLNSKYTSLYDL